MREILDYIVSDILEKPATIWTIFGLLSILLIAGASLKNKWKGIFLGSFIGLLLVMVCVYVFFLNLLNPLYLGFGKTTTFDASMIQGELLVGVDHLNMGDSFGDSTDYYRLQVINQQNGKTIFRTMIGSDFSSIEKIDGQKIWLHLKDKTVVYDLQTGEKTQ